MSNARLRPEDDEYQRLTEGEIAHYLQIFSDPRAQPALIQATPPSWLLVEIRAAEMVRAKTGATIDEHVLSRLNARPGMRMLSLGSGPGGVEIRYAREAPGARVHCVDLNPGLLEMGRARAAGEGLAMTFEAADLNRAELPAGEFDVVYCHASLHHILELERLMAQIRRTLRPGGQLIVEDVVTMNGYAMWPETRTLARAMFATLPPRFRINHTAYAQPAVDAELWEEDTSTTSMECIRTEDILPLLRNNFRQEIFVPFFSLSRRFLDTMYGPNYALSEPLDRALIDWIWQMDVHGLESGRLRPETFFGVYSL